MATAARHTISVWRNDDVFEYPVRIVGLDLSDELNMALDIRDGPDVPGPARAALRWTTDPDTDGLRVAGVTIDDGVPTTDLRIQLTKETRQGLPYGGVRDHATILSYAAPLWGGRTRLYGEIMVLAHAFASDGAPSDRSLGTGKGFVPPSAGVSLVVSPEQGVVVAIEGAGDAARAIAAAEAARDAVKPLYGVGAPAPSLGIDGSTYYDITDPDDFIVYGPKQGASWGAGRSLKGSPGGNIMAVGTRDQLAVLTVPVGTRMIQTTGDAMLGDGAWQWVESPNQSGPSTAFHRADSLGRWFDKLDRFDVAFSGAQGGTDTGVRYFNDPRKARFGVIGTDAAPQNDEVANWAAISSASPTEGIGGGVARVPTLLDTGVYTAQFGRNGLALQDYSFVAGGHDNIAFGVASVVGGAGSATGNPAQPITGRAAFLGYCSVAIGKNAIAIGQAAAAFGDNVKAGSRGSVSAGYRTVTKASLAGDPGGLASDGVGAVALGYSTVAAGDGAAAIGRDVRSYSGAITIGSGINAASFLTNRNQRAIGIGANSVRPTIEVMPGTGTTANFGYTQSRGDLRFLLDLNGVQDSTACQVFPLLTNSGALSSCQLTFRPRSQGSIVPGFAVNARSGVVVFEPENDNAADIGSPGLRPKQIYAVNTTISTSDAREKTPVNRFNEAELAAAKALGREIGWFQWLDAVVRKGDDARHHIGMTVQRAIAILEEHGLDPWSYAFICYDAWDAVDVEREGETREITTGLLDMDERPIIRVEQLVEAGTDTIQMAGNRYSFRMDQLLAFIAAGLEDRLTALECQLSADGHVHRLSGQ